MLYVILKGRIQELEHLTASFGQLKQAQAKFKVCGENVAQLSSASEGAHFEMNLHLKYLLSI
jgi:prefoldin subunit 5